jgi:transposase
LSLKGTPIKELMKIFEVTRKTIYNWFSSWEENKLLGLYDRAGRGRKPKLTKEQEKQVKEWVKEDPKNLKNVQIKIEKEWDYKISKDTNQNFPAASGRGMENVLLANRRFSLQL